MKPRISKKLIDKREMPDLSPYKAIHRLGNGGREHIYLSEQPKTGKKITIKLLATEFAEMPEAVEGLLQIAKFVSAIEHPNIAKVLDSGFLNDNTPFVANEHLEGRDLSDLLAESQSLDYRRVVNISRQICAALSAAHKAGLVHLDIKPDNIFIESKEGDKAKLLDFGIANLKSQETQEKITPQLGSFVLGTPEYWSPEQACNEEVDGRSDIYSLGIVMYEALTGKMPFRSHSYSDLVVQHIHRKPSMLKQPSFTPIIPDELKSVVLRCLKKDPAERFQSAHELDAALEQIQKIPLIERPSEKQDSLPKTSQFSNKSGTRNFSKWWVLGIVLALALLVKGAFMVSGFVKHTIFDTNTTDTTTAGELTEPTAAPVQPVQAGELQQVSITITSEPQGAYLYFTNGGSLLGKTPAEVKLAHGNEPVSMLLRFPSGEKKIIKITPEKSTIIHVKSPALIQQGSGEGK